MKDTNKILFTSDEHWGHSNILKLCNRPFKNILEHDKALIENHNMWTDNSCETWHLGDLGYKCSAMHIVECLEQLNGKHYFLFGNHDKPLRDALKRGHLDKMIKSGKVEFIGTEDHTELVAKKITINQKDFILSHYAFRSWPQAFRGSIHLYGHSHNNLPSMYRSKDVGVDTNEYMPWTLTQILQWSEEIDSDFSEQDQ